MKCIFCFDFEIKCTCFPCKNSKTKTGISISPHAKLCLVKPPLLSTNIREAMLSPIYSQVQNNKRLLNAIFSLWAELTCCYSVPSRKFSKLGI